MPGLLKKLSFMEDLETMKARLDALKPPKRTKEEDDQDPIRAWHEEKERHRLDELKQEAIERHLKHFYNKAYREIMRKMQDDFNHQ